jgi:hypothetical protein
MRLQPAIVTCLVGTTMATGAAVGDTIVQTGEIMELGTTEIVLDQFDDQAGTRTLNFVLIELSSSMAGGFTTSGTGGNVRVQVAFDQSYALDTTRLAATHCRFSDTLSNDAQAAFSFFVTDDDSALIAQPVKLAPWIGTGQITLTSFGEVNWHIVPLDGLLDYGVNLNAEYTITYDFSLVDCSADLNDDGVIDVQDLLAVVSSFGSAGGPEDLNGDGIVDVRDLLLLLSAWGPCP